MADNKYERRYRYAKTFIEGKAIEHTAPHTDNEVRRGIYSVILKSLDQLESEITPQTDVEYRIILWSAIGSAYSTAEHFTGESIKKSELALDVAEELAAIVSVYNPKE